MAEKNDADGPSTNELPMPPRLPPVGSSNHRILQKEPHTMEISAKVRRDQRRRVVDPRPLLLKSCNTAAKNVIINKAAFASMYANHDEPNSLSHIEGRLEVDPFQKSISRRSIKNADCLLQKKSERPTSSSHKSVIPLSTRILTRRFILVEDSLQPTLNFSHYYTVNIFFSPHSPPHRINK